MIIALTKLIICSNVLTVCNPKQVVYFTNHEFFTLDYREFEICQIVSKCLRLVDKEYSNQWPTQSLIFAVFRLVYFLLSSLKRIRSTPPLYLMSTPTRWELYTVCMTWNKHESWQYYDFVSCFLPFSEGCLFEECSIGWHVYVFILQPNNKIFVKQVFFASKRKKLYLSRGVLMLSQNADLKRRGNTNRDQPSRGISSYDDFILFLMFFSHGICWTIIWYFLRKHNLSYVLLLVFQISERCKILILFFQIEFKQFMF